MRPDHVSKDASVLDKNHVGAVWILGVSDKLELPLCVIARTGPSGHRSATATEDASRQHFFLVNHVSRRRKLCTLLHPLSVKSWEVVLRLLGAAARGIAGNYSQQFDYIETTAATSG